LNELYILNDTIESEITKRGLTVYKTYVGNYFTSLEMVGATLTVFALDAETKPLLDLDVACTILL
jgi:phosphoenolpyruvate---glycerone phosphotransferase subunit DhaK